MSVKINKSYPLTAMLINAAGEEVTEERMEAVFKALGLEDFSAKRASMFCLSSDKIKSLICNAGPSQSDAPVSSAPAAAPAEEKVQEDSESSADLDFGF